MAGEAGAFPLESRFTARDIACRRDGSCRSGRRRGTRRKRAHIGNDLPKLIRAQLRIPRHGGVANAVADVEKYFAIRRTSRERDTRWVAALALCGVERLSRGNSG